MRRACLFLVLGAVTLGITAGPAAAQDGDATFGCIPTSETPFQIGLQGPLPFDTALVLAVPAPTPSIVAYGDVSPDGNASFPPNLASGTYDVVILGRFGFIQVLGTVQIGKCSPTTKAQCVGEGWRSFDFRNQGQCIAFVNRGERPK